MHIRVPSAGHGKRAAIDMAMATIRQADLHMAKAKPAAGPADDRAGHHFGDIARRGVVARIDDRGDIDSGGGKVGGGAMPVIIVGEDGHALGRGGGKAVHITAYRAGLHDPGPVIVGESDQPFGGTAAQQRPAGIDSPENLPRLAGLRRHDVVAGAFQNAIDSMIEDTDGGASRHDPHIRQAGKFRRHCLGPCGPALPANGEAFLKKPSAGAEILIDDDHLCAGAPGGQRRCQPGRSAPDHEKVAMTEPAVIDIRVILARQCAKPGGAPDNRLIDAFPEGFRPHEGLVVEPSAKEGR